jgi:hypothetical protein
VRLSGCAYCQLIETDTRHLYGRCTFHVLFLGFGNKLRSKWKTTCQCSSGELFRNTVHLLCAVALRSRVRSIVQSCRHYRVTPARWYMPQLYAHTPVVLRLRHQPRASSFWRILRKKNSSFARVR